MYSVHKVYGSRCAKQRGLNRLREKKGFQACPCGLTWRIKIGIIGHACRTHTVRHNNDWMIWRDSRTNKCICVVHIHPRFTAEFVSVIDKRPLSSQVVLAFYAETHAHVCAIRARTLEHKCNTHCMDGCILNGMCLAGTLSFRNDWHSRAEEKTFAFIHFTYGKRSRVATLEIETVPARVSIRASSLHILASF